MGDRRKEKHLTYYELLDALAADGCPICRAGERAVARYLDALLYESVNDPEIRAAFRRSEGFCEVHARHLLQSSDGLGRAILYLDLLEHLDVAKTVERARRGKSQRPEPCILCDHLLRVEDRLIATLVDYLDDPDMVRELEGSPGLCLAHLCLAAAVAKDKAGRSLLIEMHQRKTGQLRWDLTEFIRKHDYRFAEERITEAERRASERAIVLWTGGRARHRGR